MAQLDAYLESLTHGAPLWMVFVVAALLGLRHATDPDHLAAISTLVAKEHTGPRDAVLVGRAWGLGHGLSMVLFGLPVVLFTASLPSAVYQMAEAAVGVIIIYFAVRLVAQVMAGRFHFHKHRHPHDHEDVFDGSGTRRRSFGVGMVHGLGGSYAAALLVLASFHDPLLAAGGLLLFASMAVVSMMTVTGLFALMLTRHQVMHRAPLLLLPLALVSFLFGLMYLYAAVSS